MQNMQTWKLAGLYRRLWMAFALTALVGCSLTLNTSVDGHTCGPNGECLSGYLCNAANVCVAADKAQCSPACDPLSNCVRQQCVPACISDKGNVRACPSGYDCENGACTLLPAAGSTSGGSQALGARCVVDSDCPTIGAQTLFCLVPFGGNGSGFCTANCESDGSCGGAAPKCQPYRSETGSPPTGGVHICAPASFLPCNSDADCSDSGLVCGVYETGTTPGNSRSVSACRSTIPRGLQAGAQCNVSGNSASPCINGLCVASSSVSGNYVCTTSCGSDSDCAGLSFEGVAGQATCQPVTVGGMVEGASYPFVRSMMCVPKTFINAPCTPESTTPQCGLDAPDCVSKPSGADGGMAGVCAPPCTDDTENVAQECPNGYQCNGSGSAGSCISQ